MKFLKYLGIGIGVCVILLFYFLYKSSEIPEKIYRQYVVEGKNYFKTVFDEDIEVNVDTHYLGWHHKFEMMLEVCNTQNKHLQQLFICKDNSYTIIAKDNYEDREKSKAHVIHYFNKPLRMYLNEKLKDDGYVLEVYSTDLLFWKKVNENLSLISNMTKDEVIQWLIPYTNETTYFYGNRSVILNAQWAVDYLPINTVFWTEEGRHKITNGKELKKEDKLFDETY